MDGKIIKPCSCCKKIKESNCFSKLSYAKDGFNSRCKECDRKSKNEHYKNNKEKCKLNTNKWKKNNKDSVTKHRKKSDIKKRFGLTLEEYAIIYLRLWEEQKGCCAICGLQATSYCKMSSVDKTTLHLDHCHKTGKIRGLLCFKCNSALGYFGDNANNLYSAYTYLNK